MGSYDCGSTGWEWRVTREATTQHKSNLLSFMGLRKVRSSVHLLYHGPFQVQFITQRING